MQNNPDRPFENLSGLPICFLQSNYGLMDRRGRRSLQGEIKLPYENQPFHSVFLYLSGSFLPERLHVGASEFFEAYGYIAFSAVEAGLTDYRDIPSDSLDHYT